MTKTRQVSEVTTNTTQVTRVSQLVKGQSAKGSEGCLITIKNKEISFNFNALCLLLAVVHFDSLHCPKPQNAQYNELINYTNKRYKPETVKPKAESWVPELSLIAHDLMSIPITTVASESSFSTGKKILTLYRSRLFLENVEAKLCTKSWLYGFEGNLIFFL